MYLEHFGITEFPFTLTPNLHYFCHLSGHQEALNTLLLSLRNGEGFIKIVGEVGAGKTILCRKLLDSMDDNVVSAYIPNPDLTPAGLRRALALELGLEVPIDCDQHTLLMQISDKLLDLHRQGRRVVVLIDEAQALSDESLEALRLLTNLETQTSKLLQIVLFGQPELDIRLQQTNLRQLRQRITFSYNLKALKESELDAYLCHRLAMAGYTHGSLFSRKAEALLFKSSKGTPRLINVLAHKALMAAFGKGQHKVTDKAVWQALLDTEGLPFQSMGFFRRHWLAISLGVAIISVLAMEYYHWLGMLGK